jgi:hypothetical protein
LLRSVAKRDLLQINRSVTREIAVIRILSLLTAALLLSACAVFEEDTEREIDVSEVPELAVMAALEAVPGLRIDSAELEEDENGASVYELEGMADGVEYEVEVTAAGDVLEVERED